MKYIEKKLGVLRRKMLIYQDAWKYREGTHIRNLDSVLEYSSVFGYNPNYKPVFNQMTAEVMI